MNAWNKFLSVGFLALGLVVHGAVPRSRIVVVKSIVAVPACSPR